MNSTKLLQQIKDDPSLRQLLQRLLLQPEPSINTVHYCVQCGMNEQDWMGVCLVCLEAGESV